MRRKMSETIAMNPAKTTATVITRDIAIAHMREFVRKYAFELAPLRGAREAPS